MPYIIAALAAWIESYGVATVIAEAIATIVVDAVIAFALGKVSQLLAGNPSDKTGPPAQTLTVQGTLEPRRMLYGQVLTAGVLNFVGASSSGAGNTEDLLWFVIILCGHQVDSITDVWFDSVQIPDSAITAGTGVITSGQYAGFAKIWRLTGTSADVPNSQLATAFPALGSNWKGLGVAKIIVQLKRSQTVFPTGAPSNFRAMVKGKRVYDPRLDSTNGGSGSQRLNDATTWLYSANPALCAADYMTGGSIYFDVATPVVAVGIKVPTNRVNWSFAASAANTCDQTVSLPGSPSTQTRYVVGALLSCTDKHDTNLDILLAAMIGQRIFVQGAYRIYAGQYDSPGVTIGDDDLTVDGFAVQASTAGTDLYNAVVANYFDPNRDWQNVQCAVRTQTTYETADGGQRITRTIDLSGVTDEYRAQRICEVIKKQSRNQIVATLYLKLTGVKIAPWETFNLNLSDLAYVNKVFRAQAVSLDLGARRIIVTAKEESSTPYADPLTTDYATASSAAPSNTIEAPDDPNGLLIAGIPYGIQLSWNQSSYWAPGSYFNVYELSTNTPFASAVLVATGIQGTSVTIPKSDTVTRFYWVRAFNAQGQASPDPYPNGNGLPGKAQTVDTSFLTANAAGTIASTTATGQAVGSAPTGTTTSTVISLTVTTTGSPVEIDVSGSYAEPAPNAPTSATMVILRDGAAISAGGTWQDTSGTTFAETRPFALLGTDSPSAASHTYTLSVTVTGPTPTLSQGRLSLPVLFMKVREIKR